ncbi:MAG: AI-2E family transporter [Myxococcales bacterium]|nr:AI-2E family transporter [Myxococcales bacterium]
MESAEPLAERIRRRALPPLVAVAAAILILWALSHVLAVLLLGFAGLLLALSLRGLSDGLSRLTKMPPKLALPLVILLLIGLIAAAIWFVAPGIGRQIDQLAETLPAALHRAGAWLDSYEWGRALREEVTRAVSDLPGRQSLSRAGGFAATLFGALGGYVVFLFVGLFLAFDPSTYRRGLLRLVPPARRERAGEVLAASAHVLRMWMFGKAVAMVLVGVLTWLGLTFLDIPLALTLAVAAALLTFIPNIGPILAAVPALLLALLTGPQQMLYVALLYVAVQSVESYIVTPLIQQQAAKLPPALVLLGQVAMGALAGSLGLILATPLVALTLTGVRMLYVEDFLGDDDGD